MNSSSSITTLLAELKNELASLQDFLKNIKLAHKHYDAYPL